MLFAGFFLHLGRADTTDIRSSIFVGKISFKIGLFYLFI